MVLTQYIPKIGNINGGFGLAPFQFPYSQPNYLKYPVFNNNSIQLINGDYPSNYNGSFGLQYLYTSIPPFTNSSGGGNSGYGSINQIAGGTINSFGVFDYVALMSNPTAFAPLNNSYTEQSLANFAVPGKLYVDSNYGNLTIGQSYFLHTVKFPTLNYLNVSVPNSQNFIELIGSTYGSGNAFPLRGPFGFYDAYGNFQWGSRSATSGPRYQLFYQPFPSLVFSPVTQTRIINGVVTESLTITPEAGSNMSGVITSPITGNTIFCTLGTENSPSGMLCGNVWSVGLAGNPDDFWNNNLEYFALGDSTDNAFLNPSEIATYRACIIPGGHFLLMPFNATQNVFFIVLCDFSGYYRMTLYANSTAAETVLAGLGAGQKCFGMDLNGNFWATDTTNVVDAQPLLYSTLGLGLSLTLTFPPNLSAVGYTCQRRKSNKYYKLTGVA